MKIMPHDQPHRSKSQWYAIAAKNGISKGLFYNRLKQGWNERDAATTAKRDYHIKNPPPKSEITTMAEKSGLSYGTVYHRIKRGWSATDAVTVPPSNRGQRASKVKRENNNG